MKRKIARRSPALAVIKYIVLGELFLQSPLLPYYFLFGPGPMTDLTTVHYIFLLFPLVGFFTIFTPFFIILTPFFAAYAFLFN